MSIITGIILTLLLLGIMVLNIFHVFIMPFHKWQLTQVTRETRLVASNHFLMLKNVRHDVHLWSAAFQIFRVCNHLVDSNHRHLSPISTSVPAHLPVGAEHVHVWFHPAQARVKEKHTDQHINDNGWTYSEGYRWSPLYIVTGLIDKHDVYNHLLFNRFNPHQQCQRKNQTKLYQADAMGSHLLYNVNNKHEN